MAAASAKSVAFTSDEEDAIREAYHESGASSMGALKLKYRCGNARIYAVWRAAGLVKPPMIKPAGEARPRRRSRPFSALSADEKGQIAICPDRDTRSVAELAARFTCTPKTIRRVWVESTTTAIGCEKAPRQTIPFAALSLDDKARITAARGVQSVSALAAQNSCTRKTVYRVWDEAGIRVAGPKRVHIRYHEAAPPPPKRTRTESSSTGDAVVTLRSSTAPPASDHDDSDATDDGEFGEDAPTREVDRAIGAASGGTVAVCGAV
jgi:hypothetical protein